jgi:SOS-response transcriptional repressor LexA
MSWATRTIEKLNKGETVQIRPRGNSMSGKIESGNLVTIQPISEELEKGDIVLCHVKGNDYLHLIKAIDGERYQIGNNRGGINGWTGRHQIFGKVIRIES